jgi:hypothetical protein
MASEDTLAQGIAWAIAVMSRDNGPLCRSAQLLYREAGMTMADFEAAAVDDYDLSEVRKVAQWKERTKRPFNVIGPHR